MKDIGRTVIREYGTINAENIARFFIAIREPYPITQKLHIILDGAGYHRSELVKDWAYGHLEKPRRLHFLFLKTLVYCSIWVFCEHIKYKKQTISFGHDLISR